MSDERLDPLTEERIYLFKVLRDDETLAALRSRIAQLQQEAFDRGVKSR